ncbi:MAG: hypothetical protein AAGF23_11820 [Acidobacteriota bacterium]
MQLFSLMLYGAIVMAPTQPDDDALLVLEETRIALAGGRDVTPDRVEIEAIYQYADDDQEIRDRTVMEPGRLLFQEREIAGETIRRSWTSQDAFIESPNGRIPLDDTMRAELETYFCLRQLELLMLCPGAVAEGVDESAEHLRVIRVRRQGEPLADVEIDVDARRLVAIRYADSPDSDDPAASTEVRYSGYQTVAGGWTLPHRVQTLVDGKTRSSYSVQRWQLDLDA